MSVVDRSFDQPFTNEEHATMPLAGGIMQQGYQCGQLWGAAFAAGAQAYRLFGPGPQAEAAAVIAAQRLVKSFQASYKSIDCFDVIDLDWKSDPGNPDPEVRPKRRSYSLLQHDTRLCASSIR